MPNEVVYGPRRGQVRIRLSARLGLPEQVKLFFTEHRSSERKQLVFTMKAAKEILLDLPTGEYTMQVHARGFETVRGLAEVDARRPFAVAAELKPREKRGLTFEARLAQYGIDVAKTPIVDLEVPAEQKVVLDHATDRSKRGFQMLTTRSIADVKRFIGSDDARFGHDRPVFGPPPHAELVAALDHDGKLDARRLGTKSREALAAVAREYVFGNSKAVARYEPVLNQAIASTLHGEVTRIPFYFYRVVTIGAGATLEVGNGSALFACDELRIHKTGTLQPVNSVTIQVGTYKEFA